MKKVLKSRIFLVIICGIVFTTIGAFASIAASNVTYNNTTVDLALDELYSNVGKVDLNRLAFDAQSYQGVKTIGSKTSINVTSGNYIIIGLEAYSSPVTSDPGNNSASTNNSQPGINQTTDTCTQLGSRTVHAIPGSTFDNKYHRLFVQTRIWKCTFDQEATVEITENSMGSSNTNLPLTVMVEAIKLD